MISNLIEPRAALNKVYLNSKIIRAAMDNFKVQMIAVLDAINEKETEEFHKNLVISLLKKTFYDPLYFVNTKGRNDLVIHNGANAKSSVGVIIEAKSPVNKSEMITVNELNGKALQELVLYYLRERITHKNTDLKQLVVTNIYEWFIFDAHIFNQLFAENKKFVKDFIDFEEKRTSGKTTDYFYKEIAKPFIELVKNELEFTHFNINQYDQPLRNEDTEDDKLLVGLYKLLTPEHLLKLPFANDSNTLDKGFYEELLHIVGLTEVKEGGKKIIVRLEPKHRNAGSLLENAITQLESLDKITRLKKPKDYGETKDEILFGVALELCITWINRILFLKLLEAQIITYHKGSKAYSFLNSDLIKDYDKLNTLFFQVLAVNIHERNKSVFQTFINVPYLNSSLFEPTELEHETIFISGLEDDTILNLLPTTVIKNNLKKKTGDLNPLEYLFSFLDAYNFATDATETFQADDKKLINAAVLGLIFEKINGYKDGSFFTPSFITMYMCRETIRRAVVQKFNEAKSWNCKDFTDLRNQDYTIAEANKIINSIKICDPAVGSGHFLASALNEIIAIKFDMQILADKDNNRIRNLNLEIANDELIIDESGELFQYDPKSSESQRIQETLFHEKRTIIENCLFGVDINPNSVKICQLRLWIELLKNAYYLPNTKELETFPNIDINIKCGNSLISRFGLDADLKKALKDSKWTIDTYKNAVATYQNSTNKAQKREMTALIEEVKSNFKTEIGSNDPKKLKLEKAKGELFNKTNQTGLFELGKKEAALWNKQINLLASEITVLETEIEEIKSSRIYDRAFEWRFEFPQVLNDDGDFMGFDVVIGNPPYMDMREIEQNCIVFYKSNYVTASNRINLFALFIEKMNQITTENGNNAMIVPRNIIRSNEYDSVRKFILDKNNIDELLSFKIGVFDDVTSEVIVLILDKSKDEKNNIKIFNFNKTIEKNVKPIIVTQSVFSNSLGNRFNIYLNDEKIKLLEKILKNSIVLGDVSETLQGIIAGDEKKFIVSEKIDENYKSIIRGRDIKKFAADKKNNEFINYTNSGKELTRARKTENFEISKKILTQHVSSKIIAIIDYESEYYMQTVNGTILKNKNIEYEFLLSILNSKLIDFYYDNTFNLGAEFTTAVAIENIDLLPIKWDENINQQPFIQLVDKIITLKKSNPQADTSQLEAEIDAMVYELYGLSEEEIAIVAQG
jgi:adenine-specific DNA-methyltransferase